MYYTAFHPTIAIILSDYNFEFDFRDDFASTATLSGMPFMALSSKYLDGLK